MWVKSKTGNLVNLDEMAEIYVRQPNGPDTQTFEVVGQYRYFSTGQALFLFTNSREEAEQYRDKLWEAMCAGTVLIKPADPVQESH